MTSEDLRLLRDIMLHANRAGRSSGSAGFESSTSSLEPRTAALIEVAVLLAVDSDAETVRWAVDDAIAAGVEDTDLVAMFRIVAPVMGTGRTASALNKLLSSLEIDLLDESPGDEDDTGG